MKANIAFPTRYRFGWGRRAELAAEVKGAGIARPLVISDPGVSAQPWFEPPGAVFAKISSNPTVAEIAAAVAVFRNGDHDGVVAIGGGAAIDAAKLIALAVGHGDALPAPREIRGERIAPIVAMPTTSGTGSEVSTGAVVVDGRMKRTLLHPNLMPRAVVADPEVTVGLPPHVTAATGLDALTHAIEAWCAPGYHPMCDAIAREAIAMIFENLPRAVASPTDADARGHLMMAASMAAVAFQKGLGLVHAMAHPLGAVLDVHHGLANAVLLPHVLAFNQAACPKIGQELIDRVRTLERAIGLPETLARTADPRELAQLALGEKLYLATTPRAPTLEEVTAIYRAVLYL